MSSTTLAVLGLCSFTVIMPFCAAQRAPEEEAPVEAPARVVETVRVPVETSAGATRVEIDKPRRVQDELEIDKPRRIIEVVPVKESSLSRIVKVRYDDGTYRMASLPAGAMWSTKAIEKSGARDPFQPSAPTRR